MDPHSTPRTRPRAAIPRRRHSHHSRSLRNFKLATGLFALGFVAAFIGWIHLWMSLGTSEQERLRLAAELRHSKQALETAQARVAELAGKLKALVTGRLPELRPFVLDQTLDIRKGYVKNISFTRVGRGDHRRYEYRLVLENNGREVLTPKVHILLFEDSGIQIGDARPGPKNAANVEDQALDFLAAGESRSYVGTVRVEAGKVPRYFTLRTR